jgi:hypothetical protein
VAIALGVRADDSFDSASDGWSCLYTFGDSPYLLVQGIDGRWRLTCYSPSGDIQTISGSALTLTDALRQFMLGLGSAKPLDAWEPFFKAACEGEAALRYAMPTEDGPFATFIPDGVFKWLILPLGSWCSRAQFEALAADLQDLQARWMVRDDLRRFEFFKGTAIDAELGPKLSSSLARIYRKPVGSHRLTTDMYLGKHQVHRLQMLQQAETAYIVFPLRSLLDLVALLRARGVLASRADDRQFNVGQVVNLYDPMNGRTTLMDVGDIEAKPDQMMWEAYYPDLTPEEFDLLGVGDRSTGDLSQSP